MNKAGHLDDNVTETALVKNKKNNDPGWLDIILYTKAVYIEITQWLASSTKEFKAVHADVIKDVSLVQSNLHR